jgi:hypothetical protein
MCAACVMPCPSCAPAQSIRHGPGWRFASLRKVSRLQRLGDRRGLSAASLMGPRSHDGWGRDSCGCPCVGPTYARVIPTSVIAPAALLQGMPKPRLAPGPSSLRVASHFANHNRNPPWAGGAIQPCALAGLCFLGFPHMARGLLMGRHDQIPHSANSYGRRRHVHPIRWRHRSEQCPPPDRPHRAGYAAVPFGR